MKKVKDTFLGILVLLIIVAAVIGMYRFTKNRVHYDLAKRIAELSPMGGPPETIEGLKIAIAAYEAQIELNVKEGAQTGVYWKILATRYADRGMHRDALDALERALYFNATDATLYYLTGESASIVAASVLGFSGSSSREHEHYAALAESAYLRAIHLDSTYAKPRLGLGLLYVFDLDRCEDAIPHMERYLELMPNETKGMFVLARAYFVTGSYDRAIDLYDRIIARTKDPQIRSEAQNNKDIIRNLLYG